MILKIDDNNIYDEKKTSDYYNEVWSEKKNSDIKKDEIEIPGGFHWGLFEKGIKTMHEAMVNMNDYVGKMLDLDQDGQKKILDAGCGMGTTSLHLARKYPNVTFTGMSLGQNEVLLAKKYSKKLGLKNVNFLKGNYLETGFPDNYFDSVFALESLSYANNKKEFVDEMYRILKPGGKLLVIDGFRKYIPTNVFLYRLYSFHGKKRGGSDLFIKKDFESQLKLKGFQNIFSKDLSKNISMSFIVCFFDSAPMILKSIIKLRKKDKFGEKQGESYDPGWVFMDFFFGLLKISTYNSIIAEKQGEIK